MTLRQDGTSRERWLVATTEYAGATSYTGGIGRHYAALLPALVRQGVAVDLAIFSDAPFLSLSDMRGVRVIESRRTDAAPRPLAVIRSARRVRELYLRGRYDRVFLPEWGALGSALSRDAPLLTNLATGVRLANEISRLRIRDFPLSRRPAIITQQVLEARQIRRSAGLIAISTAMLEWTRAAFPTLPPAAVVRNCIDLDEVREGSRSGSPPQGWPHGEDPIVLFLGRAERRKGITEAFAGFAALHSQIPEARLVVAGAGGDARFEPTRAELSATLPPSARARVAWLGHVPGPELYCAVRLASVVICPSRWEGFGNVALEVKTIGTPLVVTSGSGFDDFCIDGRDCLMARPGDAADLARAMFQSLSEPFAAAERAARGMADVERFSADAVAVDLIAAADALLAQTVAP